MVTPGMQKAAHAHRTAAAGKAGDRKERTDWANLAGGSELVSMSSRSPSDAPLDSVFLIDRWCLHSGDVVGTVDGNLIVCDRMAYTTAWTPDGLFIGTLLDRPVYGPMPESDVHNVGLAGDDWMSGGSIADLGKGEGLRFALRHDRVMAFRVRGFGDLKRQEGTIELKTAAKAAGFDGDGLKAEYFANADLSGNPVVSRVDPRLWFSDGAVGEEIVAAWAKDGPCKEIPAGKPFTRRWTGSLTAPFSEPFWIRVYNSRLGTGHTPDVQAWTEGKGFVRVWLNGQLILDKWQGEPATNPWQTPPLDLQAGETYDLKVEYPFPAATAGQFSLVWCSATYEWMRVPKTCLGTAAAPTRPRLNVAAVAPTTAETGGEPAVVRFTLDGPAGADMEIGYRLAGTAGTTDYASAVAARGDPRREDLRRSGDPGGG